MSHRCSFGSSLTRRWRNGCLRTITRSGFDLGFKLPSRVPGKKRKKSLKVYLFIYSVFIYFLFIITLLKKKYSKRVTTKEELNLHVKVVPLKLHNKKKNKNKTKKKKKRLPKIESRNNKILR